MKKQEAHKRSLEFLDKFISTKSDVLEKIIQKHTNTISGPTYAEYLYSLNENFETIEYLECQPIEGIDWNELVESDSWQYAPPPILENKNKSQKKDSAKTQSLFFLCIIAV